MTHILLVVIYLAFISLGLPDSLLGAAWPTMYPQFDVPVSYAGIVSFIIAIGTVISSLQSDRLTKWLGAGKVTAISVAMTAAALMLLAYHGFSFGLGHEYGGLVLGVAQHADVDHVNSRYFAGMLFSRVPEDADRGVTFA